MTRALSHSLAVSAALAALLLAGAARAEVGLDGTVWESPFGRVRFEKEGELWVGKLSDPGKVCGQDRGATVVRGEIHDGMFTGEALVCYAPKCHEDEWLLALALPAKDRWVGSVLEAPRECSPSVKGAFKLEKAKAAPGPVTRPLAETAAPRASVVKFKNAEAEALYKEAMALFLSPELMGPLKLEKALRKAEQAEKIDSRHPATLLLIGVIYQKQGKHTEARRRYERAARLDPGNANYNLACVDAVEGKISEAIKHLKIAVREGSFPVDDILADDDLRSLHDQPGFEEVLSLARARRGGR